jgi:hypothetical protein
MTVGAQVPRGAVSVLADAITENRPEDWFASVKNLALLTDQNDSEPGSARIARLAGRHVEHGRMEDLR